MESHTTNKQAVRVQKHSGVTWVDVEHPSKALCLELERGYGLHPIHLTESVKQVQHSQVEREAQYLFFVLHVPLYDGRSGRIKINQVGIFLGKDFLVTIRTGQCRELTKLYDESERRPEAKETTFAKGSAYLLYVLINNILADILMMTENVISELDAIEDLVFDNNQSDAQIIGKTRQKIVKLGRIIGPKKLILEDLAQQIDSFTDQNMAKYYATNTKLVNKLWELNEEAKETIEIYKDADYITSTEQTNRILAILTLVFTFTIPVTVVATIYGMNVELPGGLSAGNWTFFGRYTTVGILVAASAAFAFGMYLYFKRKKWF